MTRLARRTDSQPGFNLKTPLDIYATEWKLTEKEKEKLTNHSLRHWNISELLDMLEFADDGIHLTVRLWNVVYSATMKVSANTYSLLTYLTVRDRGWRDPINDKQPMFWLSFRSGNVDGKDFAFVIVQEDTGSKKV